MSTVLSGTPPAVHPDLAASQQKPQYPGIPTTSDGAGMVVWVETHITQGACAYPITSSTTMGGGYQVEVANGKRNLWGDELAFIEPESEHSAASTCEGFAVAGGRRHPEDCFARTCGSRCDADLHAASDEQWTGGSAGSRGVRPAAECGEFRFGVQHSRILHTEWRDGQLQFGIA